MIRCAFRSADRGLAIKRREGAEGYRDRNHGTRMMISSGRHERISFHRVLMEEESRCIRLIAPLNNSSGIQINNVSRERLQGLLCAYTLSFLQRFSTSLFSDTFRIS